MPKQNDSSDLPRPPPNYEPSADGSPDPLLRDEHRHSDDDIPDDFKYDRILSKQC